MKKIYISCLFLFLILSIGLSQNRFDIIEADLGISWASIHPCKFQHDFIVNPYASILYKRELKENIYIMSGLTYQRKGTEKLFLYEPQPGIEKTGSAKLNLDYLTIPLVVELEFIIADSDVAILLNGGGFYSILLNDEWTIRMEETTKEPTNIDLKNDAGLTVGTGFRYLLNPRLELIARFNIEYGFKVWTVLHPRAEIQNVRSRNYPFRIGLSYLLGR